MTHEPVHPIAEDQRKDQNHQHAPVGPAPLVQLDRGRWLKDLGRGDLLLHAVGRVVLMDQLIGIEPVNQRTFGLFHYADLTEVRVRNVTYQGNWPRSLLAGLRRQTK